MAQSQRQFVREIYSEVLFELAEQDGCLELVMQDLAAVGGVFRAEPEFAALMSSQVVRGDEKAQVIRRVFEGKVNNLTLDFLSVLSRRNRLSFLGGITDKYEILVDNYHRRSQVEVTLARQPSDPFCERLKTDLSDAIDCQVKLVVNVDPAIIGGIIIKKDDAMVDNSIKNALQRAVNIVMDHTREKIAKVKW